jgi:hypothetical protein
MRLEISPLTGVLELHTMLHGSSALSSYIRKVIFPKRPFNISGRFKRFPLSWETSTKQMPIASTPAAAKGILRIDYSIDRKAIFTYIRGKAEVYPLMASTSTESGKCCSAQRLDR